MKLIEFDIFNPEKLIRYFNADFNLMNWIKGKEVMVVNKAQEASIVNDLKVYIFFILGFLTIIALLIFASVIIRKLSEKILPVLNKVKQSVFWNQVIETIDITYLQIVLTCGT